MLNVRFRVVLLALISFCLAVGCASPKPAMEIAQRVTSLESLAKKPADATYIVDAPDAIRIEFMSPAPPPEPARTEVLRQDGCVTLPYLEDVKVGGMTTIQIREKLENLYSKYYKEPRILVSVAAFGSKHLYVYGEVGRQGTIPYTGSQTFSDVMGAVGGVTTRAAYWRCKVIRGDPDSPEITKVNFRKIMLEGDAREDVSLAENDVIRVPPTALAWIGYRIDDLLFPFRSIISGIFTAGQLSSAGEVVSGSGLSGGVSR